MENYPAIAFLVRHGKALAVAVAFLPILAALAGVASFGLHWAVVIVGIVAGLLAGFLVKVMTELTIIIIDMLLPK